MENVKQLLEKIPLGEQLTTPLLSEARQSHRAERTGQGPQPHGERQTTSCGQVLVPAGRGSEGLGVGRGGREVETGVGGGGVRGTRRPRGSEIQEPREAGSFFGGWGSDQSSQPSSRSCQ